MTVGVSFVFVFFLLIIMIALAGLISLAIILYKASYRRYLDKRIAEHSLGKKKAKTRIILSFLTIKYKTAQIINSFFNFIKNSQKKL